LRRLFEMGFTNRNRNAVLLEEEDWDMNKVVERLTLDSPGTPDAGREGRVGGGSSSQDQSVPSSKGGLAQREVVMPPAAQEQRAYAEPSPAADEKLSGTGYILAGVKSSYNLIRFNAIEYNLHHN